MRHIFIIAILASSALADSALVDADGSVSSVCPVVSPASSGFTVVDITGDPIARQERLKLRDEYGRCRYRVVNSRLVERATPRWCAHAATRAEDQRGIVERVDDLHTKLAAVERWQALYRLTVRDRQAEADSIQARIDQMIGVLTNP